MCILLLERGRDPEITKLYLYCYIQFRKYYQNGYVINATVCESQFENIDIANAIVWMHKM